MDKINSIAIIGADGIGERIGGLFSKAGLKVAFGKKGLTKQLSDADMIIEVFPDVQLKKEILRQGDEQASADAILVTTASGGITEIAATAKKRARVIGLNFIFNPSEEKCLVQMVKGLETSAETIEVCRSLVEKAGAVAVTVDDVAGLIADRTMASVINEAATVYLSKVATIEDIDRIARLCLNWSMGPFEFADYVGIDNVLATLEAASKDGQQYLPCRLLRQMVAAGRLGKKTGKGFYSYS